ncbi:unnamed protein product, partial [Protopolystoma xenopodis]
MVSDCCCCLFLLSPDSSELRRRVPAGFVPIDPWVQASNRQLAVRRAMRDAMVVMDSNNSNACLVWQRGRRVDYAAVESALRSRPLEMGPEERRRAARRRLRRRRQVATSGDISENQSNWTRYQRVASGLPAVEVGEAEAEASAETEEDSTDPQPEGLRTGSVMSFG